MKKKSTTDNNNNTSAGKPSTMSRRKVIGRALTYSIMALATVAGVAVCIAWAMGYRFSLESGEVSQVALLQFNSYPRGALVEVNGTALTARTPTRSNIKTGETTVKMSRDGYRAWTKTVTALPSTVRWLDYVRFVPQDVRTESVRVFSDVSDLEPSPNREWALIVTKSDSMNLVLVDLRDQAKPSISDVELAADQVTSGDRSKFSIDEWDSGSRYVLIRHDYDDTSEYLRFDRDTKQTVNLSRDFGVSLSELHFSGNSGNILYALTGSDLRRLDYGAKSISTPLATNVTDYVLYGNNRLAYITKETADDKVTQAVAIYDDDTATKIKQYDTADKLRIAFSRNNDVDYLAVARGETVAIYPDPLKKSSASSHQDVTTETAYLSCPGGVDWLQVNGNGRFFLAGHQQKVVSYDVETSENYSFEMNQTGEPSWLDDYHLMDERNGALVMIEFDGQNAERIATGKTPAFLSSDQDYLFSLDDVAGGVALQRSTMTTD